MNPNAAIRVDRPTPASTIGDGYQIIGRDLWAWWILGPVQWHYQTVSELEETLSRISHAYAAAAGHDFHLRVSSIPFDSTGWAQELDGSTPDPLPDTGGSPETWPTYLERAQRDLSGSTLRVASFGVCLGQLPRKHDVDGPLPDDLASAEAKLSERFDARPAHARELAWLVQRSKAVGVPAGPLRSWGGWGVDDSPELTGDVKWTSTPVGQATKVSAVRDGQVVERWVTVLAMGRMEDQRFPENGRPPWLAAVEDLRDPQTGAPVPVEVSVSGRIVSGKAGTADSNRGLLRAKAIRDHYRKDHGEDPPPTVDRTIKHAVEVHDEVSEGPADVAARVECVIRVAVTGDTEAQCHTYARLVQALFNEDLHMWPAIPGGPAEPFAQPLLLAEFQPGHPPNLAGYPHKMPVRFLSAAVPNKGDVVGTPEGPHLGWTVAGTPRPFFHDGHYPMRHNDPSDPNNNSGFVAVFGNLGSGKSHLLGVLAEDRARRGIRTTVLDGSMTAPFARLVTLDYLAPYSRLVSLAGAAAGTLNPYVLLPTPTRDMYDTVAEWDMNVVAVEGDRKELVVDTLLELLPHSTRHRDGIEDDVRAAVADAGGKWGTDPMDVVEALAAQSEVNARIAVGLREMARGVARLMFPTDGRRVEVPDDALLTVITMGSLQAPDETSDPREWSSRDRAAKVATTLAFSLATRGMYRDTDPKSTIIDEVAPLVAWRAGRSMMTRAGLEGRKSHNEIVAGAQDPEHMVKLGIGPFLGGLFCGRQLDEPTAKRAFKVGNIDGDPRELLRLPTGQFVHKDTFGRVARIRVKRAHDALFDVLNTETSAPVALPDRLRKVS